MTPDEVDAWIDFYRLEPFDDFHRYHRPAALVAHTSGGAKLDVLHEYLQPRPKEVPPELAGYSEADLRTFAAFGVTPPPRPAKPKQPVAPTPEGY